MHSPIKYFEKLWCREEHHVDGKLVDGIDEDALFDDRKVQPGFLRRDARRQSRRPRPHDGDVSNLHFV